jgi:TnpA family transposase
MTMYNDPLLSDSQTSQTVIGQQSTAISNKEKIHKNDKGFLLQAKKVRGSQTTKFFKITIP